MHWYRTFSRTERNVLDFVSDYLVSIYFRASGEYQWLIIGQFVAAQPPDGSQEKHRSTGQDAMFVIHICDAVPFVMHYNEYDVMGGDLNLVVQH
jgi:hypothetical protein